MKNNTEESEIKKEKYEAAITEIARNTDLLWNRFNTFSAYEGAMIGLAIIITIQAYTQTSNKKLIQTSSMALTILSIIGVIITFCIWLPIHKKSSEYVEYWLKIIYDYEKQQQSYAYTDFFKSTEENKKGLIRKKVILLIKIIGIMWILFLILGLIIIISL